MKLFRVLLGETTFPKLGIIPGGTGNLITKLLEINQDIDGAIDELDFNLTNKIDIGKANDNYFGYIFSIGSLPEAIPQC